jgi:hypothetical protein|tara:strand:+ start:527 stop:715 length:189 start_codon:yes stop_codon:yes gene_type:complete
MMAMHKDKKSGKPMTGGKKRPMNGAAKKKKMNGNGNGLTPAQKKLPPALQAAILKSKKKKSK